MRGIRKSDGKHARTKHGMHSTSEYKIWKQIIHRCCNPNCGDRRLYGGRGIKICDRWKNSFESFCEDMGPRPSPQHSVDRYPNKNGNYEPGNCRWATQSEQMRNKRTNVLLTKYGTTLTLIEWSEKLGINYDTLRQRVMSGRPADEILQLRMPPRPRARRKSKAVA